MFLRRSGAALAVLALTVACSAHRADVLRADPAPTATAVVTPTPTPSPTPVATVTITAVTQAPVAGRTSAAATVKPRATTPPPTTQPSPTAADTRPSATVVVVNHASMTVDGMVGDVSFHLVPGESSGRKVVHIDPAGNTGIGVHRSDAADCGSGGPKYLQAGHIYTVNITDGATCFYAGKSEPGPQATVIAS